MRSLSLTLVVFFHLAMNGQHTLTWFNQYGGASEDLAGKTWEDVQGNIFLTGSFAGVIDADPGPAVLNITSTTGRGAYLCKLSAQGILQWVKVFESAPQAGFYFTDLMFSNIVTDLQGNILIAGSFKNVIDLDPGTASYTLQAKADYFGDLFLLKLDPLGNFIFAKHFENNPGEVGQNNLHLSIDQSGNILLGGIFGGWMDMDPGPAADSSYGNTAWSSTYFIRLTGGGTYIWGKMLDVSSRSITVDKSGNIIATGFFSGTADFDPGPGNYLVSGQGTHNFFICKLNADASLLWVNDGGNTSMMEGQSICADEANNIVVSVMHQQPATGLRAYSIAKYDSAGSAAWQRTFFLETGATPLRLCISANKQIEIAAEFLGTVDADPGNGSVICSSGSSADLLLISLDSMGVFSCASHFTGNYEANWMHTLALQNGDLLLSGIFANLIDADPGSSSQTKNGGTMGDGFFMRLSDCNAGLITGIDNQFKKTAGTVWPVPTEGTINFGELALDTEVSIWDRNGALVYRATSNERSFSCTLSTKGIYFYQLKSADGVSQGKFIVH